MKVRTLLCILVIFAFGISAQFVFTDEFDWPRWRGSRGDGISNETDWNPEALAGGPKILWKANVGRGFSNVAIKDNRLYTMGVKEGENILICLKAETGKEIWRYAFESRNDPKPTPTIDGKYAYALSYEGTLFCVKAKNGKHRWSKDLVNDLNSPKPKYGYATSPVIEGDHVIVNAKTSGIAVDKNTDDKVWEGEINTDKIGRYFSTPFIYDHDDKRYVLIFSNSGLFSMDVETRQLLWFYEWTSAGSPNVVDPIVFDNKVFISSSESNARGALLDIKGDEPSVLWENEKMSNHISTSVYIDGYLYGIDGDYHRNIKDCSLRCIDSKTGGIMWEKEMRGVSIIAADGKLIILVDDGTLHIAEATPLSYQEISSCDILEGEKKYRQFWTHPVLCRGKIYCRNYVGGLVCIDVSK